jgi:hypothetical protein
VRSLAIAAGFVALAVWGCVLFAYLLRPVVMAPKGGLWYVGCVKDSLGFPRQTFYQLELNR